MGGVGAQILGDGHGDGLHLGTGQDQGEGEAVPGEDEGQQGSGHDAGLDQGHQHLEEDLIPGIAVHLGGILDLHGDVLEITPDHPDEQGHTDELIHPDQTQIAIIEADLLIDHEQGQHHQDLGGELEGQDLEGQVLFAVEVIPGQGIGGGDTHHHRHQHGAAGHDQAVLHVLHIVRLQQHRGIVAQGGVEQEGGGEHLGVRLEGDEQHPDQGEDGEDRIDQQQEVHHDPRKTEFLRFHFDIPSLLVQTGGLLLGGPLTFYDLLGHHVDDKPQNQDIG